MLKLAYALHKLRVKHATQQAIHLEDSVAATRRKDCRRDACGTGARDYVFTRYLAKVRSALTLRRASCKSVSD